MVKILQAPRLWRSRLLFLAMVMLSAFAIWWSRKILHAALTLIFLPFTWGHNASQFLISQDVDGFDVTFANYSRMQETAGSSYQDKIPPILHHILLENPAAATKWQHARQSCLEMHPGWETHFWTDAKAEQFVAEKFPALKNMWDGYRFPIQRIDALRYFILYEYGGVVLDMDLQCRRSLGPLRRFEFVAPAAHPVGFSNGFMMASRGNKFIKDIIAHLETYNRHWFGLAYPTVMFSTGCHFASTIHALQRNRSTLKILSGPKNNIKLHQLNGAASTPLFNHLGSSSWHSFDAAFIVLLGHLGWKQIVPLVIGGVIFVFLVRRLCRWRRMVVFRSQKDLGGSIKSSV
ncbi:putative glycosyl transferase [Colletotrichum truncatum]|uniref:Glycosyl transferase n=1 Tax=Colletotrichum truncatum TaxID=5467 RepID=A0ACC3YL62_COLTU